MEWFGDEYCDVFAEPSEADKIIDKAVNDLSALLTDAAKSAISEALDAARKQKEAEDKLEETEREIKYAERKLASINEKIEAALKRADEIEIRDIPDKYLNRMVRRAIGSYAPGDKVWIIQYEVKFIECPLCHGQKELDSIIDGKPMRIKCPECSGDGKKRETPYHIKETEISDIYLKLCFGENRVSYWNLENIRLQGRDYDVSLDRIFATKEEAEKALEKIEKEK